MRALDRPSNQSATARLLHAAPLTPRTFFVDADCARLVYFVMRADCEEQLLVQLVDLISAT